MNENKTTLWLDSSRSRYFLIPDQQPLPQGNFLLWSPVGGQKKVDPAMLPPFEVSAEVAKEHLGLDISQAFQQVKTIFANFITFFTQGPGENPERTVPASQFWQALLGVNPADLQNNPQLAKTTLINLMAGLQEIMAGVASEDPAQLEAARTRMRQLRANLRTHGINAGEKLEKLPDQLHELYRHVDQEQSLKTGITQLQTLIDRLEQFETSGQSLDELYRSLRENFKDIFVKEDETRRQEEKMKEYRRSARQAIDAAVEAHAPAINFKKIIEEVKQQKANPGSNQPGTDAPETNSHG